MSNKFNRTNPRTRFFPFKQHRFKTENHPVLNTTEKRASKVQPIFSLNERRMVEGLANVLQCDESQAVRIATYELGRNLLHDGVPTAMESASNRTQATGHKGRRKSPFVYLPKTERVAVLELADRLGLTERETIRTAVIWLATGIRDETIKRLHNSRRIGQTVLADEWLDEKRSSGEENPGTKLKNLRDAADQASLEKQTQNDKLYEERGEWLRNHQLESRMLDRGFADINSIDVMREMELEDAIGLDQMTDEEKVDYYTELFDGDVELAKAMVYGTKEDEDDEEIDDDWISELLDSSIEKREKVSVLNIITEDELDDDED